MRLRTAEQRLYPWYWQQVLPVLVGGILFMTLMLLGHRLLNDPDIYWHEAVGRWILAHHAFPHTDAFSFTFKGAPWIAKEWLSQIIFAITYEQGGWTAIVIVTAAAIALAFALIARRLIRDLSPSVALGFALVAFVVAAPHLVARPHALALPLLVVWTAGLIAAVDDRRAPRLGLLGVMVIWANTHAGFSLGLALVPPLALEAALNASRGERKGVIWIWARFFALTALACCITPYGPGPLIAAYHILDLGPALQVIGEWRPPDFSHITPFEIALLAGFGAALYRGIKLPPIRILLVLGLVHLALAHARNGDVLAVITPLLLARPIGTWLAERDTSAPPSDVFAELGLDSRWLLPMSLAIVVALGASTQMTREMAPDPKITPSAALAALRASGAGPVLNDYDFGGYLIFAGTPTFIDGRGELYGGRFTLGYEHAVLLQDLPGFLSLLDKYHIGATLLEPGEPAVALLDRLPGWRRLYADDVAVVHVRTTAAP
jgi:hypothetical protein